MRVAVVGATGVLGRSVVAQLLSRGHDVAAAARSPAAAARLPAATAVVGDVWQESFRRRVLADADAVMMLATSIPSPPAAAFHRAWRTNARIRSVLAPAVAQSAAQVGASVFVQESMMLVYADGGAIQVTEQSRVQPARSAQACLTAEQAAASFPIGRTDARSVALRFGLFVAPGSSLTRSTLDMARAGRAQVFGPLDGYTAFVHVDDAAAAAVHALTTGTGTYNVAAEPTTKSAHLADLSVIAGRQVSAGPELLRRAIPVAFPVVRGLVRSNPAGLRSLPGHRLAAALADGRAGVDRG